MTWDLEENSDVMTDEFCMGKFLIVYPIYVAVS